MVHGLAARSMAALGARRYVLLYQLGTHNRALLFYVLINNLEELAPIVYTPIVGAHPFQALKLNVNAVPVPSSSAECLDHHGTPHEESA